MVYRALNDLMQKGMVYRLESRSAFIACGHGACDGSSPSPSAGNAERWSRSCCPMRTRRPCSVWRRRDRARAGDARDCRSLRGCRRPDAPKQKDFEMRGQAHRHVALVAASQARRHSHAVAASALCRAASRCCASRCRRGFARGGRLGAAVGRGVLGVGVSMQHTQPAIEFRDLTLGYDRHPAVHHITAR